MSHGWMAVVIALVAGCGTPAKHASGGGTKAPVAVVPGPCVDAAADAAKRLADVGAPTGDAPTPQAAPDVDGDGTPDLAFTAGAGVTTNTLVYVVRGTCAHYVGDVQQPPEPVTATSTRHHGLVDLEVTDSTACEGARCGCEPGALWFRFDGTAYALDRAASKPGSEKPCAD